MRNFPSGCLTLLLFLLLLQSCHDEINVDCQMYHWSYEDESGPATWSECFSECEGNSQSPVDIRDAVNDPNLGALSFGYNDVPFHLINNGHTIQFEYAEGSSLLFQGTTYELIQFHFHAPSEHFLEGQQFPLELHLVHRDTASGNLAVIGIFFTPGDEHPALPYFLENLPEEEDEIFTSSQLFNADVLLPSKSSYYTYEGSLTTPPCSEIVKWIVMETPVEISTVQLNVLTHELPENNRPVQDLSDRQIRKFE